MSGSNFRVADIAQNTNTVTAGTTPVTNDASQPLTTQYVSTSPDSLSVTALVPNVYIATGAGNDFIDVHFLNGGNILDGGAGTNTLTGGTGNDRFEILGANLTTPAFDVLIGFHPGDIATIFGINPTSLSSTGNSNSGLILDAKNAAGVDLKMQIAGSRAGSAPTTQFHVALGVDPTHGSFISVTES